jgi:nicotinate-nucleotide adenylyltransferase
MRLGLLGGTFDPIHQGHLDVALVARDALGLDRVLLIPARIPPHRAHAPCASGYHRFAMVARAVAGHDRLEACDLELRADGMSYTSVTLARLRARGFAPTQLFFITGADAFAEIATWHDYPALLDASHFIVISRPGHDHERVRERLPALADRFVEVAAGSSGRIVTGVTRPAVFLVEATTSAVSSTEVRRRIEDGASLDELVPAGVLDHIKRHRLYQPMTSPADVLHDED